MATPVKAMLWELWRLSSGDLIFRTFFPVVFVSEVFYLRGTQNPAGTETVVAFILVILRSVFSDITMNGLFTTYNGFNLYLGFSRPISTVKLVAIPMVYNSCMGAISYLISFGFLHMVFHIPFSLFPVAVMIATVCVVFSMAVWSMQRRVAKVVNLIVIMMVFYVIFQKYGLLNAYSETFYTNKVSWRPFPLSIQNYMILLAIYLGSIVITTLAVHCQRHGKQVRIAYSSIYPSPLFWARFSWAGPFMTKRQAQYWYEMRRSGVPLLLFGLGLMAISLIGLLFFSIIENKDKPAIATLVTLFAIFQFGFLYRGAEWLCGLQRKLGVVSLTAFDITQAMDNGRIMLIKIIVLFTCGFLNCLFMLSMVTVWSLYVGHYTLWIQFASTILPVIDKFSLLDWSCISLVMFMTFFSAAAILISATLFATRYTKIARVVCSVGFLYFMLFWLDLKQGWMPWLYWETHAWIIVVAFTVATVMLWRKVLYEGFLLWRHLFGSLCLWSVYIVAMIVLYLHLHPDNMSVNLSVLVLGFGSLTLPLFTIAAAPLSLALFRHQ